VRVGALHNSRGALVHLMNSKKIFDAAVPVFAEHLGPIAEVLVEEAFQMAKISPDAGELTPPQQFALKTFLRGQLPRELDTTGLVRQIFDNAKR
jgi:hypothetical protein